MLPNFILEEIFSLLCLDQALSLRRVSLKFSKIIISQLLKVQTLGKSYCDGYCNFLLKHGWRARGLIIQDIDHFDLFQESGMTLKETFPNVRAISLHTQTVTRCNFIEEFTHQCLALEKLIHLSLSDLDLEGEYFYPSSYSQEDIDYPLHEDPYKVITPLLYTLHSLYTNFWPKTFFDDIRHSPNLNKLFISTGCRGHTMVDIRELIPHCSITLTNNYGPIISSNDKPTPAGKWLHFGDWNAHYYALVPSGKLYEEETFDIFPTLDYMEVHDFLGNDDCAKSVMHCTVINVYNNLNDINILVGLEEIPSLELILNHHIAYIEPPSTKFKTTKLSLNSYQPNFKYLLSWIIDAFPALEHLYIDNVVKENMLPLQPNAFPSLTNFYSSARQSDQFWDELIDRAPNLVCIHTDTNPENLPQLLQANPSLEVSRYTTMFRPLQNLADVSGFTAALSL